MPGMHGRELRRTVRETHPDVRFLFMSGFADREAARPISWTASRSCPSRSRSTIPRLPPATPSPGRAVRRVCCHCRSWGLDKPSPAPFTVRMHNQLVINQSRTDQLSVVFGALADPTRRAILDRLAGGEATVGELRAPFAMSQPAISKHLKVLEGAGLVSRRRQGTANLSRLEPEALGEADAWLERYRAAWEERFGRLEEVLAGLRRPQS